MNKFFSIIILVLILIWVSFPWVSQPNSADHQVIQVGMMFPAVGQEEKDQILQEPFNRVIWKWVAGITVLILFFTFYLWNRRLQKEILARQTAQAALEDSKTRLQQIVHHMPVMLVAFDEQMNIIEWNMECERVTGFTAQEMLRNPNAMECLRINDSTDQHIREIFYTKGHFRDRECELCSKNGQVKIVSWSNISGQCPISGWAMWLVGFDITDRKISEKNLIKSQEKSNAILQAIPDLILQLNSAGIVLDYHGATQGFYTQPQSFIGKSVKDILPPDLAQLTMENIQAVLTHQGIRLYEYELDIKDKIRFYECRMVCYGQHEILTIIRDITAMKEAQQAVKESERRYHALINNLNIGVYRRTPGLDGKFIEANPAILKMFGYKTKEEFFSVKASDFYQYPEEAIRFDYKMKKYGFVKNEELHLKKQDGKPFVVFASTVAVKDDMGNVIYFDGILEDVTERKNIEKQFLHAQKMEAIGTLTGGIAHDINNILMGIQGNVSILMLDQTWSNQQLDRLKKIEQIIHQGADLTRHLLNFTKGGKDEIKPVNLNQIVKEQIQIFGRTKKNILTHESYENDLWIVEADPGQISQVILNILINAWQAMPDGGSLFVRTENAVIDESVVVPYRIKYGNFVKISITDTGIGMDEETKQRIFEPFFSTKEPGKGTGLGLFTSFGIIKNHGGFITVYSERKIGSTFNIYLPASEKQLGETLSIPTDLVTGNGTILLVDDEEIILDSSKEMIEVLGYKVFISTNGKHAINFYKNHYSTIDLVILDIIMPGIGGAEVYEALKQINPNVKVILSSGYSINGEVNKLLQKGCNAFIQKPFSLHELSMKIQEVLKSPV